MKKSEKKVLTSPDCHGIIIVVGSPDWLSGNKKSKSLGYRQAVRHWILTPAFRRFESFYPSHVGAVVTAPIFYFIKNQSLAPPFANSIFADRRNFGPAFGRNGLGEKRLLCGRFASFFPKNAGIFRDPAPLSQSRPSLLRYSTHPFLAFCFLPSQANVTKL